MPQLVWLVTGCSSGLGEELVHEILARGDRVIATGRNAAKKLSHLKDTGATILDIDVTSPQKELNAKMREALAIYGGIDVIVPNAGYSEIGFVEELRQVIDFHL
jgi:NADP-dependent 3-hydroxy acid dehydrogenase YdfG